jgi:16S rRNA processing protein RimM
MSSPRILIGVFGAPHGVRGEVRIKPFTDEPLALKKYGPLESEDGRTTFKVVSARMQGDMIVAKIDGVADRDAAAKLTNLRLFVPREKLPAPDDGEFYYADLIGLRAEDEAGTLIGTVRGVDNFGAGDLLEIAREGTDSVHVPFTDEFVPTVDLKGARIVIAPGNLFDPAEKLDEDPA